MTEIDPNKILAAATSTLVKDFTKSLTSSLGSKLGKKYAQYFEEFSPYLGRTYTTCSNLKTIINKERPIPLDDVYVKAKFKCNKDTVDDDSLCQLVRDGRRIIVTGFGGIGKTVFCKYLFNSIFKNPAGKVPVFFELRRVNDLTERNLSAFIRLSLSAEGKVISEEVFRSMMLDGRFVFILDGFDEIPDEFKNDIQRQILEMAHIYRDCGFVISSRLDDRFASWQEFFVYRALPFEKDQTAQVIQKADFDRETKKEFIANIFEKRYDDYKGFFSTPLLTLMMLMTYLQIRHIPDNVHVFYRYAFQTLFTLHDASKEGFQRKRRLNLSEQEFMHVFSIFCVSTYSDMEHTFLENKCIEYIEKAKKRANGTFDSRDFLVDATDAVNMLFKDGDQYTFIHRSFQEYFTAYAVTHYFVRPIRQVLRRLPRREADSVFSMARAMSPAVIDEFYLMPEYDELSAHINKVLRATDPIEILRLVGYKIDFGYHAKGRSFSPYMYGAYSDANIDAFINIAYMMFKDKAPASLADNLTNAQVMKSFRTLGNYLSKRGDSRRGSRMVDVEVDLEAEAIQIRERPYSEQPVDPRIEMISISEVDIKKQIPILFELSQRVKSRSVFVKRSIDELRRNHKKARDTSDDILSM